MNRKYAELFELAPVGYFVLDTQGRISEVNQKAADLLGLERSALLQHHFVRYVIPDLQDTFRNFLLDLTHTEGATATLELQLFKKNGPIFYADLSGKRFIQSTSSTEQFLIAATDVTRHPSATDTLNELTSTIIAELNHPLGVMTNYVYGCMMRIEKGDIPLISLLHPLQEMNRQLHRAEEIILRMKNFHCKNTMHLEASSLDVLVEDVFAALTAELNDFPVDLHYRPLVKRNQFLLDKNHVKHILLNLTRNAIEAMKDAHTIQPKLIIEVNQPQKKVVEFSIVDNGPGFPPENIHQLFDLNFTTKPYGVGVGLAVSRAMVESHGGKLSVELNPTQGACFKFTIPLTSSPA